MFDLLLEAGADVNGVNDQYEHWSPLMLSVHHGSVDMRDELMRRGARVGLFEALMMSDDRRFDEIPAQVPNGGSPLNFARTAHAIDRLLELGASATLADRWGATPMDAFSRLGAAGDPLMRHLIARGVPATPVQYARLGDQQALLECAPTDDVFMAAVDAGRHALVAWLLSRGANPNSRAQAQSRQTALHTAAWNGDLQMVKLLVDAGADLAARDGEHKTTPCEWAETAIVVKNDHTRQAVVEYLRPV